MIDVDKLYEDMEASTGDKAIIELDRIIKERQFKQVKKDDGGASSSAGFTQSTDTTSGITAYDNTDGKARRRYRAHDYLTGATTKFKLIP
jgi:hypothetical protein